MSNSCQKALTMDNARGFDSISIVKNDVDSTFNSCSISFMKNTAKLCC